MSEVREGYKMTELGEIPVEWQMKKFKDLGTFKKGKGIAKKDLTDFGNQCILYGHLYTKYKEIIKKVNSFTNISPKDSVIGKTNDLLIPSSGETAIDIAISSALTVNNVLIGGDINLFTPSNDIDSRFLSYQINSIRKKDMAKLAQGSSVYHLYAPNLENFLIVIPSFREQQKIADILSTVDTQIEQTEQMIEQTKELKHGLMQQLLTKGIGHREFKESNLGDIPSEWEIIKLGQLADIHRGASPRPIKDPKWFSDESTHGWIRISDVTKSNKYLLSTEQHLSQEGIEKSRSVKPGDLIMSICGTIGRPIILKMHACIHDGFVAFESLKTNKVDVEYLRYVLTTLTDYFKSQGQPGTQVNLNTAIVEKAIIALPKLEEQQKIAEILSSVDDQIDIYEKEKEKYEELKKGLMQQLLTGKIRVKVDE